MSGAVGLDHVGVAGPDLPALAAEFSALGFCLTPLARHSGRRTADGPVEKFGSGNRCIMLRQGYLELISIVDPQAYALGLEAFLRLRRGVFIVALGMEQPEEELARLRQGGLEMDGVMHLERPVDDADPDGPQARFSLLRLPEAPEGRLQLIRHLTPEAIWQPRFLDHPNHAVALESVTVTAAEPAKSAARFALLTGRPATPDAAGGFRVDMPHGTVLLRPGEGAPVITGFALRTDDGAAAVAALPVAQERRAEGVLVRAGGADILFLG